ncbi:FlgO family outer membrane protein [Amphritea sp. HPY]|uniref:FlgO family outer membrane protein n=1 Tax=Amphritea sp. HPY TaxID=3421652 RepID=UPI003D7D8BAF
MRYCLLLSVLLLSACALDKPVPVTVESVSPEAIEAIRQADAANLEAEAANLKARRELTKFEVAVVDGQANGADPLSEAVAQMAVQLNAGLQQNRVKKLPIAILPFVKLGAKETGTPTGERLSENFIFQLQQHGYNLVDYRAVSLNTSAKDPLSTGNLSALHNRYRIYFVLTGTYTQHPDGVVVNARVLDTTTRQILAAAQTNVPISRLEGALPGYDPIQSMDKGMIIENGTRTSSTRREEQ